MTPDCEPSITVTLSFGSNFGDRKKNVAEALIWFESLASNPRVSSIYETPEIHGVGTPYMNAVASGRVKSDIVEFCRMTKIYEIDKGRDEHRRNRGEVPIDIDIVLCDSELLRPLDFSREFFQIGYREISEEI